ncbi:uncharacterized protein LOC131012672 [Salvia miltiorrhiza]|uniref:uncharacterized protein LOC131012672 n=1 Tax=Salvia miltiorrhiza TaxID=226208 RepID=UPI0025AB855B|nr:uncharacterized protein LOC131012672 [Salvia miltiorrhiza]
MYGLNPLNSAALFAAAAAVSKRCLRSIPIYRSLSATAGFGKRKRLPVELSGSVTMLTCESAARGGVCTVYLIGTSHRSPKSCQEVKQLIRLIKPEAVLVELCPSRAKYLKPKTGESNTRGEFQVAYEEANKYGAKFVLGDRPKEITLRRLRVMASLWDVCLYLRKNTTNKVIDTIKLFKRVDDAKICAASQELAKISPTFFKTFVHERDQYITVKLLEVAREHSSVVAVVGKAHLPGIRENWKQPVDMKQLLHVPIVKRIFTTVGGIGATVAIVSGIYLLKDVM